MHNRSKQSEYKTVPERGILQVDITCLLVDGDRIWFVFSLVEVSRSHRIPLCKGAAVKVHLELSGMNSFDIRIWPNRIRFGLGEVAHLGDRLIEMGASRALVVCGNTVAGGEQLVRVREGLGSAYVGVFPGVERHTPLPSVERGAAMARELGVDTVVSVGGGSAIDFCKGIVIHSASGGDIGPYAISDASTGIPARQLEQCGLMHIAVPTTTGSSSEVMQTCGILDPERGKKLLFRDPRIMPDMALLDPEMTRSTNPSLTATSTMTAVARCIESLYSINRNALSAGLALHALRLLTSSLPTAIADPQNIQARSDSQLGCTMSGISLMNAMPSVVHAIGHVVGGRYRLPHGTSHAILLAPAMRRFMPVLGAMQRQVLEALGGSAASLRPDEAGIAAADRMAALVAGLPIAPRLRDVGITEDAIDKIAEQASRDYLMLFAPRSVSAAEIAELIQQAW